MSKLGKKPITIPEKTEITIKDGVFKIKGPLGELSKIFKDNITIEIKDGLLSFKPVDNSKETNAMWGSYVAHAKNMIKGVTTGFEKKLGIEGVGYKAQLEGKNLVLSLGLSHTIKVPIPEGIKVTVEKNAITINGINKETVGQFSADVRALKKPEPYKGKGIRYEGEVVRKKAGKKAIATAV